MTVRLVCAAVLLGACTHHIRVPANPIDERPVEVAPPSAVAAPLPPPAQAPPALATPATPAAPAAEPVVEFTRDIRPILEARCQPCHFEGGRMYERLPFDREETVHRLGTRLFTRIKSEDEQRLINTLLAQRTLGRGSP